VKKVTGGMKNRGKKMTRQWFIKEFIQYSGPEMTFDLLLNLWGTKKRY